MLTERLDPQRAAHRGRDGEVASAEVAHACSSATGTCSRSSPRSSSTASTRAARDGRGAGAAAERAPRRAAALAEFGSMRRLPSGRCHSTRYRACSDAATSIRAAVDRRRFSRIASARGARPKPPAGGGWTAPGGRSAAVPMRCNRPTRPTRSTRPTRPTRPPQSGSTGPHRAARGRLAPERPKSQHVARLTLHGRPVRCGPASVRPCPTAGAPGDPTCRPPRPIR